MNQFQINQINEKLIVSTFKGLVIDVFLLKRFLKGSLGMVLNEIFLKPLT